MSVDLRGDVDSAHEDDVEALGEAMKQLLESEDRYGTIWFHAKDCEAPIACGDCPCEPTRVALVKHATADEVAALMDTARDAARH